MCKLSYKIIQEMKSLGDLLMPQTFPRADFEVEQEVLLLKLRTVVVDGYDVIICYSKADYGEYFLESLQVQSAYAPFLPFNVVCNIGKAFLGDDNLSFIEFFREVRKVYCWTIKSRDENALPPDESSKPNSYEGFNFHILDPSSVDLF